MVPVDEPCPRFIAGHRHEYVLRPEVAVEERRGTTALLHRSREPRSIVEQSVQALEQARPGSQQIVRQLAADGDYRLDGGGGIAEIRHEVNVVVSSAPADLWEERMTRGACVELGDDVD